MRPRMILLAATLMTLSTSCATTNPGPHTQVGGIVSGVGVGGSVIDILGEPLDLSGCTTGEASETSFLGIIAAGDSTLAAAAMNGGISKIRYYDYQVTNFLGIYSKWTTRVYGN